MPSNITKSGSIPPKISLDQLIQQVDDGRLFLVEFVTATGQHARVFGRTRVNHYGVPKAITSDDNEVLALLDIATLKRRQIPLASLRKAIISGHRFAIVGDAA